MVSGQELKEKIEKVRQTPRRGPLERDVTQDNLTDLERDILKFLADRKGPASVKEIAIFMYGPKVKAEARGKSSIRTIRNALRIPKAMDLIEPLGNGMYTVSERFKKWRFDAAVETAAAWHEIRRKRRGQQDDSTQQDDGSQHKHSV